MKFLQSVAALLCLSLPASAGEYVVVVFDTSGSMSENMRSAGKSRMEVAKDALVSVLSKVPDTTKVGLLTFKGWSYELGDVDKDKITAAVLAATADGGTPLFDHMKKGADRLLQERAKQGNVGYYKLIVVTDGEASDPSMNRDGSYGDGTFKPGVLKDIIGRGVVVDAIGLDMRKSHSLSTEINGSYMRGDDPTSLTQSLKKAVAEVGFGNDGAIGDEAFADLASLPDAFAKSTIYGLTEFQNQPIGDRPVARVIKMTQEDGTVVEVSLPAPPPEEEGGIGALGVLLILLGLVFVVMIVIGVVVMSERSNY